MKIRTILIVIAILIIFGGTFAWDAIRSYYRAKFFAEYTPPPITVSTVVAKTTTWQPTLKSVGTLVAVNGVDVNARVSGQVVGIYFKSGDIVKENQSLVQLDDSIDRQTLRNDEATMIYNGLNYKRLLSVYKTASGESKNQVDQALATWISSQAQVATDKLNIDYKNVKAPFTGKIGIREVNLGQYVTAGEGLVTLQSLDPLFVDFSLPQQDLSKVNRGQKVNIRFDSYPGEEFQGKISAINSKISEDTRTILIRATLPNPEYRLLPGLYGDVYVLLPQEKNVITLPQTVVTYSLYGDTVFIVTQKGKDKDGKPILIANQRYITVGERKGTKIEILKGIKEGEEVVQTGQIKLRNGSRVIIDNELNGKPLNLDS